MIGAGKRTAQSIPPQPAASPSQALSPTKKRIRIMPLNMNLKTKRPLSAAPYQPAAPVPTPASTPKPASSVARKNKPPRKTVMLGDLGAGKRTAQSIPPQPAASPSQDLSPVIAPESTWSKVKQELKWAVPVTGAVGLGAIGYAGLKAPRPFSQGIDQQRTYY